MNELNLCVGCEEKNANKIFHSDILFFNEKLEKNYNSEKEYLLIGFIGDYRMYVKHLDDKYMDLYLSIAKAMSEINDTDKYTKITMCLKLELINK